MYRIGDKIAELRKNRKMTQEELANIVGVSAQSVLIKKISVSGK